MNFRALVCVLPLCFATVAQGADQSDKTGYRSANATLQAQLRLQPNTTRAKNVLLFLGDGMGVSTITAARILDGQRRGESGEENQLSFETLPYLALAKTYNTDQQTPDSAGTMTAIMSGAKTRAGMIGVGPAAPRGDCAAALQHSMPTLLEQAEQAGMRTGVVTTTRLTHATPAATYAHVPERDWEDDSSIPEAAKQQGCRDIARQLIEFAQGDGLDVALGGGRTNFLPQSQSDPEHAEVVGRRLDGRDLTAEWLRRDNARYVWSAQQFASIKPEQGGPLLGLFEPSHLRFEVDRAQDPAGEPSLTEMTRKAIALLQAGKTPPGYFLMVEAGRIDHAHHAGNAYRALEETREFSRAIAAALAMVDLKETLVIVTADHSHVMTLAGYPARGNPILGKVVTPGQNTPWLAADGLPYTTLGYMNGPGAQGRADLSKVDTSGPDYQQQALVPMAAETHGGEDVAVYAGGPWGHLVRGSVEQHYLYHVMRHALGWPAL